MFENFVKAIDESLKESFEKGIEKGIFKGEKYMAINIARNLLFKRFGNKITPYLNNLDNLDIKTIEDLTNNIFDITLEDAIKILKNS
ncbi:hypothetical protein SAMN02745164_02152 [Marinitoga hydrogenitolerans DSM 16785]|uniref:DUF4351 domain-containing protein n=1 Tax=Marinitoga hydrogenitolerans (strain DSM 16785 / JCM 12826 / AT1271) TaxID=1122195 RepID=A0A1M5ACY5_MARH1|nr:hypothetical protein [Marinitoga hydrogenitolerans]SHF27752.1 hypothetical protein SAMN02745164_02152 [Marinitoga hydrogenitolerans DSM 16785]